MEKASAVTLDSQDYQGLLSVTLWTLWTLDMDSNVSGARAGRAALPRGLQHGGALQTLWAVRVEGS